MFRMIQRALVALLALNLAVAPIAPVVAPAAASDFRPGGSGPATVLRGMANGMRATIQGYTGGGGSWSLTTRSRHVTNVTICTAAALMPMYLTNATALGDYDIKTSYKVEVGVEYPYTHANTGIAPRTPLKWADGSNTGTFTPDGKSGWLRGIQTKLPVCIPKGAEFGLHTTVETTGQAGIAGGAIPYNTLLSNYNQRWTGSVLSATSNIAAGLTFNSTSIAASGTSPTSGTPGYTPAALIVPYAANDKAVGAVGDSICQGVNEGTGPATAYGAAYGDGEGSALSSSAGFVARGVVDVLGANMAINLCKAQDGYKYSGQQGTMRYRLQGFAHVNPTNIIDQYIQNDQAWGTVAQGAAAIDTPAWTASSVVPRFAVRALGGNYYIASQGGNTAASGGPTGTGFGIADGGVLWDYVGTANLPAYIYARMAQRYAEFRGAVPGVKITKTFGTPYGSASLAISALTSSGTTVTATHAGIINTGMSIIVSGATPTAYNGTYTVTAVDATHFTYTVGTAPGSSPATGTIIANDGFAFNTNQVPGVGAPPPNTTESILNQLLRTTVGSGAYVYGPDAIWDTCKVQPGYAGTQATETALWPLTATAGEITIDGIHPTSRGHAAVAATADPSILP